MGRTIFEIMTFSFCVMDEINNWFKRLGLQFLALQLCSACQTMEPPTLRPVPRLFLATCGRSFIAEQRTRCQTVHERDCGQYRKTGGDDGMHDEHQPMPGRCIRAFDGEFECPPGVRA
jgi:hypothetical protein